jgi:S1-C subfamily serine protease
MLSLTCLAALLVAAVSGRPAAPPVRPAAPPVPARTASQPAEGVVRVTAMLRFPNPIRPWTQSNSTEVGGTGVVISGNKILTNAHIVQYATEVHVQTGPGADKFEARVESIGPEVDLAVLTVADKAFFKTRFPLARAKAPPSTRDTVEVYGFPIGGSELSVTKGVISRISYSGYPSGGSGLVIQVSAAVNPGNSGGPAIVGGRMVGLVFGRLTEGENIGYVIPNEEIDMYLKEVESGSYKGKPNDATLTQYQRLENESLRALLKLDKKTRGIVAFPPRTAERGNPFQPFDVLTRIGEHDIDNQGAVRLPSGLRVPFIGVFQRLARNNAVPVTVLRKGKLLQLSLPVTTQDKRLIREFRGEFPTWFIHGPLAFSPVKEDAIQFYLRLNPGLYGNRSPLQSRRADRVRFDDEELVVVTHPMFDHKIAKGYIDPVGQVLEEVNGTKVKNLRHLVEILRDSTDEFLKFRFAEEGTEILVFRRKEMAKATEEIMEDAGIAPNRRGSRDILKVWNKGVNPQAPR